MVKWLNIMEIGLIVKNLVIVGAILGVAFLSQQPFSKINTKNYVYSSPKSVTNTGTDYLKSAQAWLQNSLYPKVSGEVEAKQAIVTQQVEMQKNNLLENSAGNTKKIIAQTILNALGVTPEELGCPAK